MPITLARARKLLKNEDAMIYDNPHALVLCHHKREKALCHRDEVRDAPRLDRCVPGCGNIARTDQQVAQLRSALAPYLTGEPALEGLEVGVAGLVYALSAAGMFPAASCRGHADPASWSAVPVVMFAADRGHAEALQPLVESSRCGFDLDPIRPELLVINGRSVEDTLRLGRAVLASIETFRSLTRSGSAGRASEASRRPVPRADAGSPEPGPAGRLVAPVPMARRR